MLPNCNKAGTFCATRTGELTWFCPRPESVTLSDQSGIESCRGLFTDLSRRPKRPAMQSSSKVQTRFGVSLRPTRRKATYLALRRIGITCRTASVASNSIPPSTTRQIAEVRLTRAGILEPVACYNEPMLVEQFAPQSRYRDSLTGSHKLFDGTIR